MEGRAIHDARPVLMLVQFDAKVVIKLNRFDVGFVIRLNFLMRVQYQKEYTVLSNHQINVLES